MAADEELLFEIKIDRGQSEKEIDDLTKSIERLKDENKSLTDSNKELKKSGEQNSREFSENAKQIEINRQSIAKNNAARKTAINAIKAEDNSLGALKSRLTANKKARDEVNVSTEKGRKEFQRLTKAIKEDTDALLEAEKAGGNFSRQVGNYREGLQGGTESQNIFNASLLEGSAAFAKAAVPLGVLVGLLTSLANAYKSSTLGSADLKSATDQLSIAYSRVGNNIANIFGADGQGGGPLSRITTEAIKAVFGDLEAETAKAAANSIRRLQELEVAQLNVDRVSKEQLQTAEQLRQARDEERNSLEDRIIANNELLNVINERKTK